MTARRLPRSPIARALPGSSSAAVTWPAALRGRSPALCLLLLGWLGGGLLATAVAMVTRGASDLAYGLTNVAAASVGLLLLAISGPLVAARSRRPAGAPQVHVPAQTDASHDDRLEPAVR